MFDIWFLIKIIQHVDRHTNHRRPNSPANPDGGGGVHGEVNHLATADGARLVEVRPYHDASSQLTEQRQGRRAQQLAATQRVGERGVYFRCTIATCNTETQKEG